MLTGQFDLLREVYTDYRGLISEFIPPEEESRTPSFLSDLLMADGFELRSKLSKDGLRKPRMSVELPFSPISNRSEESEEEKKEEEADLSFEDHFEDIGCEEANIHARLSARDMTLVNGVSH